MLEDRPPAWVRYLWSAPLPRIYSVKPPKRFTHMRWGVFMVGLVSLALVLAAGLWVAVWALWGRS